jgi:hypothetical protein
MGSPVVIFAYNRPHILEKTLAQAIELNKNINREFYVVIDGPKNNIDFEKNSKINYLLDKYPRLIRIQRNQNLGLEQSITQGLNDLFKSHNSLIVLEDDIEISSSFYDFIDENIEIFNSNEDVAAIHGFSPDLGKIEVDHYFLRGSDCWGWATWKRNWNLYNKSGTYLLKELKKRKLLKQFDVNHSYPFCNMLRGDILDLVDSWAIKWHASMFLSNKYSLYPYPSMITNIGFDGTGTNAPKFDSHEIQLYDKGILPEINSSEIKEQVKIIKALETHYRSIYNNNFILEFLYTLKLDLIIKLKGITDFR